MSSVITLSAFAANTCVALARFAIAYGGLAFTASSSGRSQEMWHLRPVTWPPLAAYKTGIRTTTVAGARLRVRVGDLQYP